MGGRVKDLIIGAADNYTWEHVKHWATSIKNTTFSGDVVLIAYRVSDDLIKNCSDLGIHVILVNHDETANPINHTLGNINTQSHKLRNFHVWQYLSENTEYRTVAITDTRDVIFQTNPSEFFDTHTEFDIYFPSEGILFKDENWNMNMVGNLFGPFIFEEVKEKVVCNSGTIFGKAHSIKKLMLEMYLVGKNFGATGADQPTMNVLLHLTEPHNTTILPMDAGWACQCGTTLEPANSRLRPMLLEPVPTVQNINGKNMFVNSKLEPFVLVHQYDRIPNWSTIFND